MANVFKLPELKDKVSRNSFDLSSKVLFSSKFGEILPVKTIKCFPGDKFRIKISDLIRTADMSSYCSTRMRQYFNIYFVPTRQLWRYYPQFVTNMSDGANQANSITGSQAVGQTMPYIDFIELYKGVNLTEQNVDSSTLEQLKSLKAAPFVNDQGLGGIVPGEFPDRKPTFTNDNVALGSRFFNFYGFSRFSNAQKLLQYLGYYAIKDGRNFVYYWNQADNLKLNYRLDPFPLLAYHKIYYDYFRNSQWEGVQAQTFNVDYVNPSAPKIPINSLFKNGDPMKGFASPNVNMLDMHYCRYMDDLYTSMKPSSQFGGNVWYSPDVAVSGQLPSLDIVTNSSLVPNTKDVFAGSNSDSLDTGSQYFLDALQASGTGSGYVNISRYSTKSTEFVATGAVDISALQIRLIDTLQRFKEIIQSNDYDYKSQIKALFNVDVSNYLSGLSEYIGGFGIDINSNAVENTNLTGDNTVQIGAYGLGQGSDSFSYSVKEHGYLMVVAHAVPVAEYDVKGFQLGLFDVDYNDQPVPALDSLGLEPITSAYLSPVRPNTTELSLFGSGQFGWNVRYASVKTDFDILLGNFNSNGIYNPALASITVQTPSSNNGALTTHALRLTSDNFPLLSDMFNFQHNNKITASFIWKLPEYNYFTVNPSVVDSIFVPQADSSIQTDVLNHYCYLDIKAVRNFSRSGMPF